MKYILCLLCLLGINLGYAGEFRHWSDWTIEEKIEYIAFTSLNYTDFAQTEICVSQYPKCREANPIFGPTPNDATIVSAFVLTQIAHYHLIGYDNQYRWLLFGIKLGVVISNDYNGIRVTQVW